MCKVGSGDIKFVMAGNRNTKTFKEFFLKFMGITEIQYNAKSSPIKACRTGAILEEQFFKTLDSDWYEQVKVTSKELDVLTVSIDFAQFKDGKVTKFKELKTVWWTVFMDIERNQDYFKKKYKDYYNQVQAQLYASELEECEVVFVAVYSYEDVDNLTREIKENEHFSITVKRDEKVINSIRKELLFYQNCKNHFNGKAPHVLTGTAPIKKSEVVVPF